MHTDLCLGMRFKFQQHGDPAFLSTTVSYLIPGLLWYTCLWVHHLVFTFHHQSIHGHGFLPHSTLSLLLSSLLIPRLIFSYFLACSHWLSCSCTMYTLHYQVAAVAAGVLSVGRRDTCPENVLMLTAPEVIHCHIATGNCLVPGLSASSGSCFFSQLSHFHLSSCVVMSCPEIVSASFRLLHC